MTRERQEALRARIKAAEARQNLAMSIPEYAKEQDIIDACYAELMQAGMSC